jgi:predicted transcriptional regulator
MKKPNDTQLRIHGYLLRNPGAHYNMIKSGLDLHTGSVTHNLRMLEERGWVMKKHLSQRTIYYARWDPKGQHECGSLIGPDYRWDEVSTPGSSRMSSMT